MGPNDLIIHYPAEPGWLEINAVKVEAKPIEGQDDGLELAVICDGGLFDGWPEQNITIARGTKRGGYEQRVSLNMDEARALLICLAKAIAQGGRAITHPNDD